MSAGAFDHILNWRLLAGSHAFPGPDGGTCINEAALVAAGLPYRAIKGSEDCPPCFSRPLASYALGLNDAMPDDARSRLMAFVLRLSGSADTPAVEAERVAFLAMESVRRVLPAILDRAGLPALAARCETVPDIHAARLAARAAESQGGTLAHHAASVANGFSARVPPPRRAAERPRSRPSTIRAARPRLRRARPPSRRGSGRLRSAFSTRPCASADRHPRSISCMRSNGSMRRERTARSSLAERGEPLSQPAMARPTSAIAALQEAAEASVPVR